MTPLFLTTLFIANGLTPGDTYQFIFAGQLLFYFMAFTGYVFDAKKMYVKIFSAPYYFCMSNLAVAMGFWKFVTGKQEVKWKR